MLARAAIYLDSNAGAPLSPKAHEALLSFFSNASAEGLSDPSRSRRFQFFNPSSPHSEGRAARRVLSDARDKIAASLGRGVAAEDLILTSSGTEANQMAIRAVLEPLLLSGKSPHWILTEGEHDATLQMVSWLERRGGQVSWIPLNEKGAPRVELLESLLRPETALVSAIWVNNETGVITDVASLSRVLASRQIPLHLDAAQAWGKLSLDVARCGAMAVSVSGHKIGGLAGTGALWMSRRLRETSQGSWLIPGKQETDRRGGTENLLGAVVLGAAASELNPEAWASHVGALRDRLEQRILERIPGTRVHGQGVSRVANTLNLGFDGIEKDGLVLALDLAGFCVSSGSACSSGVTAPSHVLRAMGLSENQAKAAIRVSLSKDTTWDELEAFVSALEDAVSRMRKQPR